MNILFLTFAYLPSTGGVQRSVHNLAREMVARGHHVTIATDGPWSEIKGLGLKKSTPADVLVLKIPTPRSHGNNYRSLLWDGYNLFRLAILCRQRNIELIHCHLINVDTRYAAVLKKLLGVKMIVTLRGNELSTWIRGNPIREEYVRSMLRSADAVTALSQTQINDAHILEPRIGRPTMMITNPADIEKIVAGVEDTQLPDQPYLLYVGRFVDFKSVDTLIEAYHRTVAKDTHYPFNLVLAGIGDKESELRQQAADGPAAERIFFLGEQRWGQSLALIKAARYMVLPSCESEGCPNVLLEAMALGTPVIVSDNPRLLEMVTAGVNGYVFGIRDAAQLQVCLDLLPFQLELREKFADEGRKFLNKRHSYEQIMSSYERLYRRLCPPPPSTREKISILMPCKTQKKEFFLDAVSSVVQQTSGLWELLILTDPSTPIEVQEWATSFQDPRIRIVVASKSGFAQALNVGIREATTPFVSILLSDDRYSNNAIETLLKYRERFSDADFLHSSRRYISAPGSPESVVMPSKSRFDLSNFSTSGCPVKHLLCWRRDLSVTIGGMDESLSAHGCDDYDFPWCMAEAGARFQAVKECLYEYRLHREHARLTTNTPIEAQVNVMQTMFAKHGISQISTDRYIQRALREYLVLAATGQEERDRGAMVEACCFREATPDALIYFIKAGIPQRDFFPHRVLILRKGGPDGMKLSRALNLSQDPGMLREMILHATSPAAECIPPALNFDDDVQWHQQQFGLPAQVAAANFVVNETSLYCYVLVSDLVQRISRSPEHRTRVDKVFHGWCRLLINALLVYARENNCDEVCIASSKMVLGMSDPARSPQPELYERVYDRIPQSLGANLKDGWWLLDVNLLTDRIAPLERKLELKPWSKTVCIIHDTEEGMGHRDTDPEFSKEAYERSGDALTSMLATEQRVGVRTTYNVVGCLFEKLSHVIRSGGHALSFHSYDHRIATDRDEDNGEEQLWLCRDIDYRIKGYRPPQSKIPSGLSAANLSYYNFEWLASSCSSLQFESPKTKNGIVWIPVHIDDYSLFRDGMSFVEWERNIAELVKQREFIVIGLHDCYAHLWQDHYEYFLTRMQAVGTLITLDEVAARVTVGSANWFE